MLMPCSEREFHNILGSHMHYFCDFKTELFIDNYVVKFIFPTAPREFEISKLISKKLVKEQEQNIEVQIRPLAKLMQKSSLYRHYFVRSRDELKLKGRISISLLTLFLYVCYIKLDEMQLA